MKLPDGYIRELVTDVAGTEAVNLVFLIKDKKNVSEFKIAESMGITVNEVRNMLYKLQNRNLVLFTRRKDKKKGWYIYYWTFDMPKARDLLIKLKQEKKQELKEMFDEEKPGNLYACPNKCLQMNTQQALEYDFKCRECDAVLVEENVEKRSQKTGQAMERLGVEIEELLKIEKPKPKIEPEPKKKPKKLAIEGKKKQEAGKTKKKIAVMRRNKNPRPKKKPPKKKSIKKQKYRYHLKHKKKSQPKKKSRVLRNVRRRFFRRH